MKNKVLILKDQSDNYYIVGPHILDMTRVRTAEHIDLLSKLTINRQIIDIGRISGIEIGSLGEIEVKENRFLMLDYTPPSYVVKDGPSNPS